MELNHIGLNIRRIMKDKGISVLKASAFLGMSVSGVYDIFKRQLISDSALLEKIGQLTNASLLEIMNYGGEAGSDEIGQRQTLFEWRNENEFLKEQIKEKDYLIKMLIESMTDRR